MADYEDIIHLPHHTSTRHPPMSRENRAAQFAPFAALTGHDQALRETARLTSERIELTEDGIAVLNETLSQLRAHADEMPTVSVTYFQPDRRKAGGAYVTVEGIVRRVDDIEGVIELSGRVKIPLCEILDISLVTQ